MSLLMILTLIAISLVCAFYGARLVVWTVSMAAGIVLFGITGTISPLTLSLTTVVFALVAAPLNYRPWRQQLFSAPFLKQYLRMIPNLSETEQVALDQSGAQVTAFTTGFFSTPKTRRNGQSERKT